MPVRAQDTEIDGAVHDEYVAALEEEAELRDSFEAAKREADDLALQVLDLDARVAQVRTELADAEAALASADAAAAHADTELRDTEARLAREQQRLRDQSIQAYIGGGVMPTPDILEALSDPETLDDVATGRVYADVVVADREKIIASVAELKERAAVLQGEAQAARDLSRLLRDDVAARAHDLETQLADRSAAQLAAQTALGEQQRLAFELETRRREYELRYAEIAIQSDSIAELLKARQKDQPPALFTYGIFLNPVKGAEPGSGYGPRLHPILNVTRMHAGLDISGPMGAPMRASADGTVVLAEERGGYGLTVVIDHGNQLATLYGHMSSLAVGPGDVVKRGDTLGAVGSTGMSTGPHCHWEVRVLGLPVDGTPYLSTAPE